MIETSSLCIACNGWIKNIKTKPKSKKWT